MATQRTPDEVHAIVQAWRKLPRSKRLDFIRDERESAVLGEIVQSTNGTERMAAIVSLGQTDSPAAEPYLLDVIRTSGDRFAITLANAALGKVGSRASIPELARLVHDTNEDVKVSAIHAISELGDASLTPLFVDALGDRSWVAKWYAMAAIQRHGDERAVVPVADRVRKILARKRLTTIGGWSELMYALDYLGRWSGHSDVAAGTLAWAATRTDRFSDRERAWFEEASRQA